MYKLAPLIKAQISQALVIKQIWAGVLSCIFWVMFVGVIILMYYGYFVGISGSLCKALRAEKRLE